MDLLDSVQRTIRPANAFDAPTICHLIRSFAEYERLTHEAVFDEAQAAETRANDDGQKNYQTEKWEGNRRKRRKQRTFVPFVSFCSKSVRRGGGHRLCRLVLFFHNYSTFVGKPGIYLEDLFVLPDYRGRGHGKALFQAVARVAVERGCGRMEWAALNWNEPAIEFYKRFGATPMSQWTTFRRTGEALMATAAK